MASFQAAEPTPAPAAPEALIMFVHESLALCCTSCEIERRERKCPSGANVGHTLTYKSKNDIAQACFLRCP